MYNVRGRPCDAADSPMKREIWVVLLLRDCMRASFQFEVILLFLTLRAIIDGAFKLGRDDFHFFVTDLFGHETRGIGYQKKHFGLYGKS